MGLRFRFGAILPIASAIASPSRVDRSAVWAMRCLLWLAAGFASFVPRAAGQEIRAEQGEIMVEPGVASPAAVNPFAAVLHASEEAGTLLRRAEEGIERQDWKLAIDSLQRMIELPGEHILARDGHVYESAGRVAQRRIAALPEPGLRAYRLVHDKEAAALLEQAVAQYDADLLRAVVDRFLLTGVGDEAAVTLADWLIDDGRLAEAASILKWLQVVYPDSDLPGWLVDARMAICLGYSGEMEQARSRLDRAAASTPVGGQPGRVEDRLGEIGRWLSSARTATGQAMAGPITGHLFADRKPPAQIDFPPELDWRVDLPLEWPADGLPTFQRHARELGLLPAAGLATDGRVVLVKSGLALLAIDVETFQPRWQAKAAALGADEQTRRSGAGLIIVGAVVFFAGDLGATVVGMTASVIKLGANVTSSLLGRSMNRSQHLSPLTVTVASMTIGAAALAATGLMVDGVLRVTPTAAAIVVWLAVVNTAWAFTLWNSSLRYLTAVESASINGTMLIQIAVLAWLFLGESPGLIGALGIAIVSSGALLAQRGTATTTRRPIGTPRTTAGRASQQPPQP